MCKDFFPPVSDLTTCIIPLSYFTFSCIHFDMTVVIKEAFFIYTEVWQYGLHFFNTCCDIFQTKRCPQGQLLLISALASFALGDVLLDDIDILDISDDMRPSEFTKDALRKMYHPGIYDLDEDEEEERIEMFKAIDFEDVYKSTDVRIDPDMYELMDEEFFDQQASHALNYEFGTLWPGSQKVPLTEEEEKYYLDLHNLYRMNITAIIPSADVSWMIWDDDLKDLAQEYSYWCVFEHGSPHQTYQPYMGQNLYIGPGSNPSRSMYLWFIEYLDYNYYTDVCVPDMICGHMVQMFWATSRWVGCARHLCWPEQRSWIATCHYWPPGNYAFFPAPVTIGLPCTRCNSTRGNTFCYNKLCTTKEECTEFNLPCECNLKCKNCGILRRETCTCDCVYGWDYLDCGMTCENRMEGCRWNSPTDELQGFCFANFGMTQTFSCRYMCRRCKMTHDITVYADQARSLRCCNGMTCDTEYELNLKTCKCELTCPSKTCVPSLWKTTQVITKPTTPVTFLPPPPPPPPLPIPKPPRTTTDAYYPPPTPPPTPTPVNRSPRILSTVLLFQFFWPQVLYFLTWLFLMQN